MYWIYFKHDFHQIKLESGVTNARHLTLPYTSCLYIYNEDFMALNNFLGN